MRKPAGYRLAGGPRRPVDLHAGQTVEGAEVVLVCDGLRLGADRIPRDRDTGTAEAVDVEVYVASSSPGGSPEPAWRTRDAGDLSQGLQPPRFGSGASLEPRAAVWKVSSCCPGRPRSWRSARSAPPRRLWPRYGGPESGTQGRSRPGRTPDKEKGSRTLLDPSSWTSKTDQWRQYIRGRQNRKNALRIIRPEACRPTSCPIDCPWSARS